MELIMPDVKRRSVAMFQTLFGVNMSIFKGAMAPGSEDTFFLAGTSISTLSITIQSKKISISVIPLFDHFFFGMHLRFYSEYHNPIKEIFNFCDCFLRLVIEKGLKKR